MFPSLQGVPPPSPPKMRDSAAAETQLLHKKTDQTQTITFHTRPNWKDAWEKPGTAASRQSAVCRLEASFKRAEATEWAFHRIQEAFEKVAKDEARKLSTVQKYVKKHRLLAAHHRASRRARRCHDVILMSAFSWEEAHQLVVCDMWRET